MFMLYIKHEKQCFAHSFPYDVKLRLLADSRSFLANQKARNAIVGAENLLKLNNTTEPHHKEHKHRILLICLHKLNANLAMFISSISHPNCSSLYLLYFNSTLKMVLILLNFYYMCVMLL